MIVPCQLWSRKKLQKPLIGLLVPNHLPNHPSLLSPPKHRLTRPVWQRQSIAGDLIPDIATATKHRHLSKTLRSRPKYPVHLADSPHPPHPTPDLPHDHDRVLALARAVTEATASQPTDHAAPHRG